MKYMIASDLHGSVEYVSRLMAAWEREAADTLLLLGDLLYHGPRNALPENYDTKQVLAMLNTLRGQIVAVRGNCDAEVDQMVLDFPIMADYEPHPRTPVCPDREAPAPRRRGCDAVRAYPCSGELPEQRGRVVSEPRLGVHPEKRLAPQLYDARKRCFSVEDAGGRGLPRAFPGRVGSSC